MVRGHGRFVLRYRCERIVGRYEALLPSVEVVLDSESPGADSNSRFVCASIGRHTARKSKVRR